MSTTMATYYEIPLSPNIPNQKVIVNADKYLFKIVAKWSDKGSYWTLDIKEDSEGIDLKGIVLRVGLDLFNPFVFSLGELWVIQNGSDAKELSLSNLGTDYTLIFII